MKKNIVALVIAGLLSLTIGMVYVTPARADVSNATLRSDYKKVSNAEADAIKAYLDSNEGKKSDSAATTIIDDSQQTISDVNKKLKRSKSSNGKTLYKYSSGVNRALNDLDNHNPQGFVKEATAVAKPNQKIRQKLKLPDPTKVNKQLDRWNKIADKQPHVKGQSIITPDFEIAFTNVSQTPDIDQGKTDVIVTYTFTNKSSKPIEPETTFLEWGEFKQESDTSIVTLNNGIPDNSPDNYDSLLGAGQQEVKPGAQITTVASAQLDNTNYPLKFAVKDPSSQQKLGSINIQYK